MDFAEILICELVLFELLRWNHIRNACCCLITSHTGVAKDKVQLNFREKEKQQQQGVKR